MGLSVADAKILIDEYGELDWFINRLIFDRNKRKIIDQLDLFETIKWSKATKESLLKKWMLDKKDLLNTKFVFERKATTYLDRLKAKKKKEMSTYFGKLKSEKKKALKGKRKK